MNQHIVTLPLFTEVQQEFTRRYPFLKIEIQNKPQDTTVDVFQVQQPGVSAADFLTKEIGLNDKMTVPDLVYALQEHFGEPVTLLRKSCQSWMETILSREWSLRQHNDHGRDVCARFQ